VFDWARALAWCRLPKGPRTAVLTNAGGPGAIAADALDAVGLELATLSESTQVTLRGFLPEAASVRNPVDMLAAAGPFEYANGLSALLADPGVDSVMVIMAPPPMTTAAGIGGAIIPLIRSASKPVVVSLMGEEMIAAAARLFRQARVPDYRFPERAASALRVLVRRAEQLQVRLHEPDVVPGVDPTRAHKVLAATAATDHGFLEGQQASEVLAAYGIPVLETVLATTAADAEAASRRMGVPVAMKVASPDIVHKSDCGGVLLDVTPGEGARGGFEAIVQSAQRAYPKAEVQGVLIQPMAPAGQDVIVGVVRDAQFGPLVMFGSGGIEVEGLQDVAFALAPLGRAEAAELLTATWAGRKLAGFRSLPPADRPATVEVILRMGQLMLDLPEVEEVEINPLRVLPDGQGTRALDVRLRRSA
jgi:acetyltransferase